MLQCYIQDPNKACTMPRKPRFFLPFVPVHVVQRGHNRQPVFFDDGDYHAYLGWLKEGAMRYGCAVHAYVLMTNHVHLLMTPSESDSVSRTLQYVGRRYVPYINNLYGRSGTLWEGRFKASLVQEQHYVLACYRYIEMNPVRAGMVTSPADYPWSSYAFNALCKSSKWLTRQDQYKGLARNAAQRCETYRSLFDSTIPADLLADLRNCVQTGTPLGNDRFRDQIEATLKVKVGYSSRGRPATREPVDDKNTHGAG